MKTHSTRLRSMMKIMMMMMSKLFSKKMGNKCSVNINGMLTVQSKARKIVRQNGAPWSEDFCARNDQWGETV